MNGPTDRETTWALRDAMGRRALSEADRERADREQADLRARVAVLERQIAAIKAAVDRVGLSDSNRIANVHVILAAGVVDNPTGPPPLADDYIR